MRFRQHASLFQERTWAYPKTLCNRFACLSQSVRMQYVRVHRGSLDLSAIRWRRCFFVADPLKLPTARDSLCTTRRRDYQCAQIEAQPFPFLSSCRRHRRLVRRGNKHLQLRKQIDVYTRWMSALLSRFPALCQSKFYASKKLGGPRPAKRHRAVVVSVRPPWSQR